MNYTWSWNGRLKFMSMFLSCIFCVFLHPTHPQVIVTLFTHEKYYYTYMLPILHPPV